MWLSAALRQRAGAFGDAAQTFLDGWLGAETLRYQGGQKGLVALCRRLERFAQRPDADAELERRFVEGAGALLGVLLIDHLPCASHAAQGEVHRVRLGEHGFFDPFGAVDRALDAADIRGELARQIERAEAEAAGRGPLSRLVLALSAALATQRSELSIESQFDATLTLRHRPSGEPIELDLRRALSATSDQGQGAVEAVVAKLLSLLPGAPASAAEFPDIEARLLPRLARAESLQALSKHGRSLLLSTPLADELVVALLLEDTGRARYVRAGELSAWGLCSEQAFALAARNLRARSERARIVREQTRHGAAFVARTGDGRDSARVLLPELYAELADRIGPQVSIALPHRDTFFACDGSAPALVEQLAQRAAEDAARAPHALSPRVFRLTAAGLVS